MIAIQNNVKPIIAIAGFLMAVLPIGSSAAPTLALTKANERRVVPTAPLGTTMRERMRDRAITHSLPTLTLTNAQRIQISRIQQDFRKKRPGTRGATEPELAVYHAKLLHVLQPNQREQLRLKMKQNWLKEHAP